MSEIKTNERLALVRAEAREALGALDGAVKVGTETYLMVTENGVAKITISAVKDENFDVEAARDEYLADLEDKAIKAEEKAAAKAAKEAEKEAKKAAKEKAE